MHTACVTTTLAELLADTHRPAEALRLAREAVPLPDGDRLKARRAALPARLQPSP